MEIPLHPSCSILARHPAGLHAVDKAEGILSHPNKSQSRSQSLLSLPYDPGLEAYVDGDRRYYLLNRLDAPTSGVILLATDAGVAGAVKDAFATHTVRKTYAALVKGIPPRKSDTWRDFLETSRRGETLRTRSGRGRPNAETGMELLERGKGPPARALVALTPKTGRTHQLRVQCAARHLPIVGDSTYGDFAFNRRFRQQGGPGRLFLHSWKTSLEVVVDGQTISFSAESPVPGAFAVALK
jgi:23S rRNA-/tRNA-specific pseudouridylate synthase